MNAVVVGPFIFSAHQAAALTGIFVFIVVTAALAWRVDSVIGKWSGWALIGGLVAARAGHVALHWDSFAEGPWRVIAFWQGGLQPVAGFFGVLLVSAFFIRTVKAGTAAVAALGVSLLVAIAVTQLTRATLGQAAPTVALQQMQGPPLAISAMAGKPVVVNLWASWCPPCRREMPLLAKVAASRDDVVFLFVNQGEGASTIRSYLASQNIRLDHVLLDASMLVPRHYRTLGLPTTLFLRADGTLASIHLGEISPETLDSNIGKLAGPM